MPMSALLRLEVAEGQPVLTSRNGKQGFGPPRNGNERESRRYAGGFRVVVGMKMWR